MKIEKLLKMPRNKRYRLEQRYLRRLAGKIKDTAEENGNYDLWRKLQLKVRRFNNENYQ